jgi:hypothetical protein
VLVNVVASVVAAFVMDGTHGVHATIRYLVLHMLQMHLAGQPGAFVTVAGPGLRSACS